MKKKSALLFLFFFTLNVFSQEVLQSYEENYYIMQNLFGEQEKNYINFRTLSDSVWNEDVENSIWSKTKITPWYTLWENEKYSINLKSYGVDFFNSYNTKAPFGQNDGALWQGRGYNSAISGGFRLEGFGFELTLRPQYSYSQNLPFEIMPSSWGNGFGYISGCCDAPQRFGEDTLSYFDWGDSEIRWSWNCFTLGFGTQSMWLGPAEINALLLSNNAPTFPKFDAGIRRTEVYLPFTDIYLGDIEGRMVLGKLHESDYFDTDPTNDENMYLLYSLSYAPPFFPGFSLGFNKVCIAPWNGDYTKYYLNPFYHGNRLGNVGEDQKASFMFDYSLPLTNTDFYAEIGVDDYPSKGLSFYEYARYPFHTMTYTVGGKQGFKVGKDKQNYLVVNFEWNCTEPSQDYQIWGGAYNFGNHYQIKQGYTNRGQWLGSGIGYGGNSQYLTATLYSSHGYDKFFIARNNPDNSFIYGKAPSYSNKTELAAKYYTAYKANFYTGYETLWFIGKNFSIRGNLTYNLIINPLYNPGYSGKTADGTKVYREYVHWKNFHFELALKVLL